MSIVGYSSLTKTLYADSICVDGYHRFHAQKAFRYVRMTDGGVKETGSAGFVGDPGIGFALVTAYTQGGFSGVEAARQALLPQLPPEDITTGDVLVVPDEGLYMWLTQGLSRPFFPIPKQDFLIGHSQLTSRVWMGLGKSANMEQAILDAISCSEHNDDSHLGCGPLIRLSPTEDTSTIPLSGLNF